MARSGRQGSGTATTPVRRALPAVQPNGTRDRGLADVVKQLDWLSYASLSAGRRARLVARRPGRGVGRQRDDRVKI
jgi:hypothetical protein